MALAGIWSVEPPGPFCEMAMKSSRNSLPPSPPFPDLSPRLPSLITCIQMLSARNANKSQSALSSKYSICVYYTAISLASRLGVSRAHAVCP